MKHLRSMEERAGMNKLNHPFRGGTCVERLLDEYYKHGKLIVAFDFDNTIFDYHNNGGDYSQVINLLKECTDYECVMILFTANDNKEKQDWMIQYCNHFGIAVDYVNENPEVLGTKKPYYNILLDDRAGLYEAYDILNNVIKQIKTNASIKSN